MKIKTLVFTNSKEQPQVYSCGNTLQIHEAASEDIDENEFKYTSYINLSQLSGQEDWFQLSCSGDSLATLCDELVDFLNGEDDDLLTEIKIEAFRYNGELDSVNSEPESAVNIISTVKSPYDEGDIIRLDFDKIAYDRVRADYSDKEIINSILGYCKTANMSVWDFTQQYGSN